ncbi:DUF6123 family protein [Cytobacillus firmus]|jgi:hypothetical protein|uniref:DUF6123 family protein n=1 Tax=Cytobacillus firmus TaxID=1399 RepID=A0A0J5W769_CYTFI|nr:MULTISPECIES: DUF6123 family protein [Bacillales]KAF0826036.1 hypothetical protein KIS1582_0175 [Cytobacillus firmus]KML46662.1 hypothetical protein VL14_00305 [Cytobacillus firmus]MBG9445120.1 hypothetical protein [Cytobacillus firmus]MBG9448918.1 hypothetical protein [Cytobacillus firmus]MBG9542988.1 hypothetical protein [Cytobacillus firmus]
MKTVEEYLHFLQSKGFQFREDAVGFIYFGKHYTNASDELANAAIELTLKAQKSFDGSFYVSLLETLVSKNITSRREAIKFVKEKAII